MRKIIYTLTMMTVFLAAMKAQETGVYSHYIVRPVLLNPGATGAEEGHHLLLNYKRQWSGFSGTPQLITFNYNGRIAGNTGVGLTVFNESIAAMNRFRASGAYAYHLETGDLNLGIGLAADYVQERISNSALVDDLTDPGDELLARAADGISYFDAAFGIYGNYQRKIYFGLSAPHLVRARLTSIEGDNPADTVTNAFRSFTAMLGYRMDLDDMGLTVTPSAVARKMFNGPLVFDLNLLASFLQDQIQAGLTYRYTQDSGSGLGVLIGCRFNRMNIFYSYDAGFGTFQPYSNGAHEISVAFTLGGGNSSKSTGKTTPPPASGDSID